MTRDAFMAWLTTNRPGLVVISGHSVTTKSRTIRYFVRAKDGEKTVYFAFDDGQEPREVGTAEKKRLGNEKRGERHPTKKSLERQAYCGRRAPEGVVGKGAR